MTQVRRLDQVCEITMGQAPSGNAYNDEEEGWPLIAGAGDFGDLYPSPKKYTREATRISKAGDIVLGIRASIGEKVLADGEYCLGRGVAGFRAGEELDSRYLWHWLTQIQPALASKARGATFLQVNKNDIAELEIALPPLPEQRRIAAILDQADALRAKRREALAQLDSLTQSIFIDMFGDPVSNERSWPTESVDDLCELVRGSSPRPQGNPRYFGGPVPRLMVADITRDGWRVTPRIDSLTLEGAKKSRPVPEGTVVMAVSGNVGLVSRLAVDACVHDGFVAFTKLNEKRCNPDYLLALLHLSKAVHEKSKAGAIFINLTTTDIKAMRLPLPDLALQREFLARQSRVAGLTDSMGGSAAQMDALFSSLQHRAFTGQLS